MNARRRTRATKLKYNLCNRIRHRAVHRNENVRAWDNIIYMYLALANVYQQRIELPFHSME